MANISIPLYFRADVKAPVLGLAFWVDGENSIRPIKLPVQSWEMQKLELTGWIASRKPICEMRKGAAETLPLWGYTRPLRWHLANGCALCYVEFIGSRWLYGGYVNVRLTKPPLQKFGHNSAMQLLTQLSWAAAPALINFATEAKDA